jgi:hypothetical protein
VVRRAAALDPARAPLCEHRLQRFGIDLEGNVEGDGVLHRELERGVVGLE